MNKIYKVIWSKVRNCYVAVSEIAKRNGKSCTSVNCGAKANRGRAGVALAIALSLSMTGGGVAWAAVKEINDNTYDNNNPWGGYSATYDFIITADNVTFVLGDGGNIKTITSEKDNNTITIQSGGVVSGNTNPISGWSFSIIAGINNNNLNSAGTISNHIAGGLNDSTTDSVVNNHVAISGGKVSGDVFGGFSNSGNAGENNKGNTVNISGGQVTGNVYGGYSKSGGKDASYNQVSVSDANASPSAKASINFAYGGYSKTGHASYNQVSVSGENASVGQVYGGYAVGSDSNYSSTATKNIVTISGGEVRSFVHGGYSESGDAGAAPVSNTKYGNTVTISGGTVNGEVYGGRVTGGTGRALYNEVIISGTGEVNNSVYGGNSRSGVAQGNRVEISGGKVTGSYSVYGGTSWNSNSLNNSVIISGAGSMVGGNVYGGQVINGDGTAKDNNVSISGSATIGASGSTKRIVGGYAKNGAATGNTVDINLVTNDNGTPDDTTDDTGVIWGTVYGGNSESGDAGGTGANEGNTVTITGGTVNGNVYGGYVDSESGSAIGNTVTIKGANLSGNYKYAGYSKGGNAKNNTITIKGGTIDRWSQRIVGGHGINEISGNTVTLTGVSFTNGTSVPNQLRLYAGWSSGENSTMINNTFNLYGNVTGLNYAEIYGYYHADAGTSSTYTGNELHIGGTKTEAMLADGTTASPWTGTTGNKVTSVNNFNSIVLHQVNWSPDTDNTTGTPVLAAGSFSNIGKLDISGMQFTGTNAEIGAYRGNMKLLASNTNNDFSSLSLTYKKISNSTLDGAALNGTATLNSTHPSQIVKVNNSTNPGEEKSSDSNNVRFWYRPNLHRVSLDSANNYKNVIYSIADEVRHIAFLGAIGWSTEPARVADSKYDFSEVEDVYVKPLSFTFTPEQAGALSSGSSMTLLSNAKGLAAGKTITYDPNDTTKNSISQSVNYSIANVASLTGTLTGTVATVANAVKYTASSMTLDTVNFGSWNGSASVPVPSGWTASGTTAINALNLMFTGLSSTVNTNPMNNSMTLLSGATGITGNHITQPGSGKGIVTVSGYNDNNGVTFDGKAKGTVSVSSNNIIYTINSVAADKLTLGSFAWGGAADTMPTGWTASVSTTIDDTNFAYTGTANTKLKQNDTAVILNATGLTTASPVTLGANANKTVGMNFTDSSGDGASSIRFTGTAKGHVEAAADKVNYVVDGATLDGIDLESWNGTPFNLDSTTWGWELAKDTPGAVTATVATAGMTVPSGLSAGEKKVIIEATGTDYFDGINIGEGNKWSAGTTLTDTAVLTSGGVTIAGKQTKAGVKVNEANKNQIVYEASKKNATSITLGKDSVDASSPVTYVKNGTARSFDNTFDVSNADIYADNLTFTDASKALMETNDTMTIVDASGAIANSITGQKLQTFVGKTYVPIAFTDTITGKNLTFAGTHTDTLTQSDDTAKSKLIYTVGAKNVTTATLSGDITWGDNSVYYENGGAENQNGVKPNYVFGSSSAINIGGVQFSATTDPMNKSMTLLKGVTGVVATKVSGTPSFAVTLDQTNTKLDAKATGSASVSGNDVIYSVNGVAIDKINVTSIENAAGTVPTGWSLAKDNSNNVIATVETDGLSVSDPSGLEPGETKVIIEAAAGSISFFKDVAVNGSHAWKVDGSTITSDLAIGGVAITGTQTKGGVKVNEANTNQIIYEESKKKINTLTLGKVTFKNDDGTASTVAHSFDKTYDVSTATISTDDLAFANSDIMETGNSMRIVDASAAIPNAISNKKLPAFTEQTKKVAFTDTITGKNLTLKGVHTDTLTQSDDTAKSKLIYTVGAKNVTTATLSGDITWGDNSVYYENGKVENQNGVKPNYVFGSSSAINIGGVQFSATTDPMNKSMTLLKDVNGVVATKVSGTPSFTVALDQTNTKLDASASGSAGVSSSDVTYTVSGVAINKVNIKSVGSTADTVPDNWTLAKDSSDNVIAKVETDNMTKPSNLSPGETKVIITATGTDYFSGVEVKGGYAWTSGGALTTDLEVGGVTIAGTQTKGGVKVNEANKNQLIYEETKKKLTSITLGEVTFAKDGTARAFDKTYDATSATINANNLKFTEASRAKMETGNTMTMVDATAAHKNANDETLAQFNGGADKTYSIAFNDTVTGKNLTLAGTHTDTLSQADDTATSTKKSKLIYTVGDKLVSSATLTGDIAWNDGGTHYTNGSDANQNGTKATYKFDGNSAVDISGVAFSATSDPLGKSMTLLKDVNGVMATKVSGTPSFTVALDQTNTKLDANATGTSGVSTNDVTFTVSGVTLNKITVKGVGDTSDTVPTGWNLASGATVETDGLRVSDPSGLEPGETKAIITATGTDYFNGIKLNGNHVWNVDGSPLTSDLEVGGVTIAGTQTKGGVKVDEANKSQLIYEESKKNVTSITLGEVTFAKNGTARAFDKTYDATSANINADSLKFTEASRALMTSGSSMTIVDASAAIKNAGGNALPSFAAKNYDSTFTDSVTDQLTLTGTRRDTLAQDAALTKLTYTVGDRVVSKASMSGEIAWQSGDTHYANTAYTFNSSTAVDIANVKFTATDDPLNTSMTLIENAAGVTAGNVSGSPDFTVALKNTTITATATGNASMDAGDLKYTVTGVTLDSVSVNGVGSDAIPAGWGTVSNVQIDTDNMTVPADATYGSPQVIMTASSAIFTDDNITGSKKFGVNPARFTDEDNTDAVVIVGKQNAGVKASADGKSLLYEVGKKEASSVTLAKVDWAKGATGFDGSSEEYDYSGIQSLGTDSFDVAYSAPEMVAAGDNMTLLQANATLKDMAAETGSASYSFAPVSGVTIDAAVTGSLEAKGGNVTYTAKANQAGKLTFTNVDWKDSGALMTRPSNITFAGADVDTAKIHFQNVKELDANKEMTLVSDFGDSVGTITGTKYTVGAGLEGEGAASLSGSDLVFTTKTGAKDLAAQEQTHNTLMVMEAGMAVLAAGNEHVGQAMAELANPQNAGLDGTVTAASLGGSKSRYKTGSHVDSDSWNVAVAVGSKRELKKGSLEWGVFGEYGKSNYTLHSDAGRGDGDSHYAGGGLMAKWTNKHDVYTEASVRLGRLSDTASNLLRDAAGNGYGYDVHANYFGAHVGIGKIIHYKGGKSLDVYGKYFYTKRDGVDFTSGGNNYSLDSVASSVLRVGARYGTTDKKWNWYGGLAYEYEFDGKSEGTVDGVGIRAASVKGGSVRGEIGMRMNATKTNPWQTDISIYGYGGKHRGFGGSVNVAYMF